MTQDEIFEMAIRAGFMQHLGVICIPNVQNLEAFATLVAFAEREACAKLCEDMSGPIEIYNPNYTHYIDCAKAIRARENT